MDEAFNRWWNSDRLVEDNPFNRETPAFWAWEGWVAGVRSEREWQGLTDEERNDCLVEADPCEALLEHEAWQLMVDIEAKLKEKNT